MNINISTCSDDELNELEKKIEKERTKRQSIVQLYRADAKIETFFVSSNKKHSAAIKKEAEEALIEEVGNYYANGGKLKPVIKKITTLREVPKAWKTVIPWNASDDYVTIKELLSQEK